MHTTKKESALDRFAKQKLSNKEIAKIKGGDGSSSEQENYIIIVDEIFD